MAHGETGSSTDRQKEAQEHRYSGELRAKMTKYAIENGNKAEIHIDLGYTFQSHSQTSNKMCYLLTVLLCRHYGIVLYNTKMLTLMDVKMPLSYKTLNILDVSISGFTFLGLQYAWPNSI